MPPSTLIIPVENQVRELDAKLLLACVAAERGFPVVLGSRTYVNFAMPGLARGVFLAKSLRSLSRLMLGFVRDLGHHVVAWDEESLVRFDAPEEYYAWRYAPDTFAVLDRLFAWGEDDASFFSAYPARGHAPIHVTGNPRIDLLRREVRGYFAPEVAALRARYGDFILVNTNFSFVNNFVTDLNLVGVDGEVSRTGRGMSRPFAGAMAAHQAAIFEHFRRLMPQLAATFSAHTVVLRPHPSENHALWRELMSGLPNVVVAHEGNVVPWLMAARVLLHNGCTTAVEAAVLETPAVTYQPVAAARHDYALPNGLSHRADDPAAVCELVGRALDGRLGLVDSAIRTRLFARHLAATAGALAADRVVDVLVDAGYAHAAPPLPARITRTRAWLGGHLRTLVKRVNMRRRGHRNSAAYHDHRFPGISEAELNARIARFGARLGRFAGVRARLLSRHLFQLGALQS